MASNRVEALMAAIVAQRSAVVVEPPQKTREWTSSVTRAAEVRRIVIAAAVRDWCVAPAVAMTASNVSVCVVSTWVGTWIAMRAMAADCWAVVVMCAVADGRDEDVS